jgi:chromosome partitioning protein
VREFHALAKAGIPIERLAFALNRVGTDGEEAAARAYLEEAGYSVLSGCLPERPAYRQAQNAGHSVTETRYSSLNERADALLQDMIDRIQE